MRKLWRAVPAVFAVTAFLSAACGKHDGTEPVSISGPSAAYTPTQTTPTPNPTPAAVPTGIKVEIVSSTFNPDRCTQLRDEKGELTEYGKRSELVEVSRITNGTGRGVYARPGLFHSDQATCGAIDDQILGSDNLGTYPNVEPGLSQQWTHRFPVDLNACGTYQFDNTAKNGDLTEFVLGKVINTGIPCPSCELFGLQLSVSGHGLTRTVKVTFKNLPGYRKATVDFGDGQRTKLGNGQSEEHTWGYGTYTVTATLEDQALSQPCTATAVVSNEEPQSCADVNVQFGFCPVTSAAAPTVTKCFAGSWVSPGVGSLIYGDGTSGGVDNPFTTSHAYSQTDTEQNLTATLTVVRGSLSCPKTLAVKIPPRNKACEDYQPPVITGDIASDTQASQVVFSSGSVAPSGGTFNPTLPQSVARPAAGQPAGSFSTTYSVPYGPEGLSCSVSKTFTKPVPPREDSCSNYTPPAFGGALALTGQTSTQVTVTSGTVTPPGGTFSPTLPRTVNRPPAGSGDGSFSTTYTVTYGPSGLNCAASRAYHITIPQQTACQASNMGQASACYKPAPWGSGNNPSDICGYFSLSPIGKDDGLSGSSYTLTMSATMAVAHWGGADCSNGAQYYQFIPNATAGQRITTPGQGGISFVQYCGCPSN